MGVCDVWVRNDMFHSSKASVGYFCHRRASVCHDEVYSWLASKPTAVWLVFHLGFRRRRYGPTQRLPAAHHDAPIFPLEAMLGGRCYELVLNCQRWSLSFSGQIGALCLKVHTVRYAPLCPPLANHQERIVHKIEKAYFSGFSALAIPIFERCVTPRNVHLAYEPAGVRESHL